MRWEFSIHASIEVAPDPTLQCAQKGVDQMRAV